MYKNKYKVIFSYYTNSLYIEKIVKAYSEAEAINELSEQYPALPLAGWSAWIL